MSAVRDAVPAGHGVRAARLRADVDGGVADQLPEPLLLQDVGAPACGTAAGEHGRHHRAGHLGEVQDDRGPELDVGLDGPVGTTLTQLGQRGLGRLDGVPAADATEARRRSAVDLTPREREIAALLIEGLTSKLIGKRLAISPRTVDVYRARLMRKYEAATTPELVHKLLSA